MITESNRKRELIINLYSLFANIGISIWFYCFFDESASMILPIIFVSTPRLFRYIIFSNDSTPPEKRKYLISIIYWLIYNALNLLTIVTYYFAKHGKMALYYVKWDEMICLSLSFSLLQLLSVLVISELERKRSRIIASIFSMIVVMLLLVLFQSIVFYYNINIGILHFVILGVLIVVYGTVGVIIHIRKVKCSK